MAGLERQVADFVAREGDVQKLAKDSREKVEEAYAARDQAKTREELHSKEVERLLQERKKAALERQVSFI